MRRFWFSVVALGIVLAVGGAASGDAGGFAVIVNSSNPIQSLSRAELSKIFLKEQSVWSDGQVIVPVDQAEDSPVRAEFSQAVLGRPVAAVKSFWQKQIFSGTAVPPVEKPTSADVATYVATLRGAVGYVAVVRQLGDGRAVVSLPPGVKVVRMID
ncbi:MAG TPA: substrate-binding domain-containing protein [Thermoanaerobaculaceae bacterium]|nr:substrate-binding domain-containing protein [Thermoanaerobaculaceae bacterium]